MNKTRSWNGCGYNDYVTYLIRECHMDRYDAAREATDEFRTSFNARSYEGHKENRNGGTGNDSKSCMCEMSTGA